MNFKTIKSVKTLYPTNFRPMAIGLGVGLVLAFSGCVSNQPNSSVKRVEAKTLPDNEQNITEPEYTAGIPPVMPPPQEQIYRGDVVHPHPPPLPLPPKK